MLNEQQLQNLIETEAARMRARFSLKATKVLPWIGPRYDEDQRKVLIIGESFYVDTNLGRCGDTPVDDEAIFIALHGQHCIAGCLEGRNRKPQRTTGNFHSRIYRYLTGTTVDQGRRANVVLANWQRWAFWELIPERLANKDARPDPWWDAGVTAFREVMDQLSPRPCLILGLGYRMRDAFRNRVRLTERKETDAPANLYDYNGTCVLFVPHPSARGMSNGRIDDISQQIARVGTECAQRRRRAVERFTWQEGDLEFHPPSSASH